MAVVVFDNGNGTDIWSDPLNWVGGSLPDPADTADLNANCQLDMSDIIAVLDVGANTLTMDAGYSLTGMTSDMIGTGTITMAAGCSLTWNTAGDISTCTVNITARGTSGSRCTIDNVGAGRFDFAETAEWDCEYTDIHSVKRFYPQDTTRVRLVGCDLEGAASSDYFIARTSELILKDGWVSNFDNTTYGGLALCYTNSPAVTQLENMVFGEDIDGNSQANGADIAFIHSNNANYGSHVTARNLMLLSATRVNWANDEVGWSRLIVDNFGYCFTHTNGSGPGTPGVAWIDSPAWTVERSTTAKKSGDFGLLVTPKATCGDSESRNADISIYIPIASGDNISVSVYAQRSGMTSDCAKVIIDPEEAWFTSDESTELLTNTGTWYELTASASTAGGSSAVGMVRIVLRVDEVDAANTVYFADMTVTVS